MYLRSLRYSLIPASQSKPSAEGFVLEGLLSDIQKRQPQSSQRYGRFATRFAIGRSNQFRRERTMNFQPHLRQVFRASTIQLCCGFL